MKSGKETYNETQDILSVLEILGTVYKPILDFDERLAIESIKDKIEKMLEEMQK